MIYCIVSYYITWLCVLRRAPEEGERELEVSQRHLPGHLIVLPYLAIAF